jgi:hypothetical protein
MARIDDLLNHVADADLRKQLGTAVGEIRDRRQFGIVYESHIPRNGCSLWNVCEAWELSFNKKANVGRSSVRREHKWEDGAPFMPKGP